MTPTDPWPYPGDVPLVVARRVAWAYRQRLQQVAPDDCAQLDQVMTRLGQTWAAPGPAPHPATWITATEAARLAAVGTGTIAALRRTGRLTGRQRKPHRWEYRTADILALSDQPRTRRKREIPEPAKRER